MAHLSEQHVADQANSLLCQKIFSVIQLNSIRRCTLHQYIQSEPASLFLNLSGVSGPRVVIMSLWLMLTQVLQLMVI